MELRRIINALIYLSVTFGLILLVQLWSLVPVWLFYSVLTGWIAYVAVALLAAKNRKAAYPLALVLACLTLLVSLPQPEHYAYVEAGLSLASATFLAGAVLQGVLIILDIIYLIKYRH